MDITKTLKVTQIFSIKTHSRSVLVLEMLFSSLLQNFKSMPFIMDSESRMSSFCDQTCLKKSFSSKMTYNGQVMITFVKLEPKTTWFCITLLRWPITISQRNLITQPARFYTLTCHKIRIWGQCDLSCYYNEPTLVLF